MAQFDAQNGFIQYIFANDDIYFLDSMARENLNDYLYYEFRKNHTKDYGYIFEITGLRPLYSVRTWDEGSFGVAAKAKQSFLSFRKLEYDGMPINMDGDQIRKLVRDASRAAFIFRLDTFRDLYDSYVKMLFDVSVKSPHTGTRIFLLAPTEASSSMHSFMDERSVFRVSPESRRIFGDIETCFKKGDTQGNSYKDLKKLRKDGVVFLNDFSEKNIEKVVRWVLWNEKMDDDVTPDQERKVCRFLYKWYRSPQMQNVYRDVVSPNESRSFQELAEDIRKWWPTLVSDAEEMDERERYKMEEELYVRSDDDNVKRLASVRFPQTRDTRQADAYVKWREILNHMMKPKCVIPSHELQELVADSIGDMDNALEKNDLDTFDRICRFLEYYNKSSDADSAEKADVWKSYRTVIQCSGQIFDLQKKMEEKNRLITSWQGELRDQVNDIKRRSTTQNDSSLSLEQQRAVSLYKKIDGEKKAQQYDMTRKNSYQNAMDTLEISLQTYGADQLAKLGTKLNSCLSVMKKLRDRTESEMDDIKYTRYDMADLLIQTDNESVINEFDRIMKIYEKGEGVEELPDSVELEPVAEETEDFPNLFDLI